jgi:hypothetical protein
MSEWVLHCAVDQRHIRRSQPYQREAALKDVCSQLLQGHGVNRVVGPNENIAAERVRDWCAEHQPSVRKPFARLFLPSIEMAANAAALSFRVVHIKDDADIEHAITVAGREQAGLIVLPDAFLFGRRTRIIKFAEQQKVPGVYAYRAFAADGGLLAYGIDRVELFRAAASYIDRVLKGERAADLPGPASDKVRAGH